MTDDIEPTRGASGPGVRQSATADTGTIETHFLIVAAVELVLGLPALLLGLALVFGGFLGAGFAEAFSDVPGIGALIAGAGVLIGFLFAALAIPAVISAVGLVKRRSWAKPWTIVAAALNLLNVPIGTLFGIYAIWVMTRRETDVALS